LRKKTNMLGKIIIVKKKQCTLSKNRHEKPNEIELYNKDYSASSRKIRILHMEVQLYGETE
jgi:hypothetical protein